MIKKFQNELECSQFEALLADALDLHWDSQGAAGEAGTLPAETRQAFEAHGRSCPVCGPLWAETREGMRMLRGLEMVDPPRNLVHNILVATSMVGQETVLGPTDAPREKTGLLASLRRSLSYAPLLLRSRFATSFIMAFFSLSVTLSLAGVRISDVSKIDWHPNALRKSVVLQYTEIESRVTRYYDNMRLVYEVESRVRGLRKAVAPEREEKKNEDNKQEQQNRNTLPDTGGRPRENDTYSQERDSEPQLAQNRLGGDPTASLIAKSTMKDEGAQI